MKNLIGLIGVAAVIGAAVTILTRKREDGTTMADDLMDSARNWGDKLMDYGSQLRDRLMHNVKGPNGEPVYSDMYDRQFYEDASGQRVYLDEA